MYRKLEKVIIEEYGNITGLVVSRGGKAVYENYFGGFDADRRVNITSVTKSIVSLLFGIAFGQGLIGSLDSKVLSFFPERSVCKDNKTIHDISLRHMMTMTAPYSCSAEPYEQFTMSEDWLGFALGILGGDGPIGDFRYSPFVGAHILSGIFARATGRSLLGFANENLFEPLGIDVPGNIRLGSAEDFERVTNDPKVRGWIADAQGFNTSGWGLFLTARDMDKIANLCLNGGVHNGRRLVPADWLRDSTREHNRSPQLGLGYGLLWWLLDEKGRIYGAFGDGGNAMYINEAKALTVSITGIFTPNAPDSAGLIIDHIEPLFKLI